MPAHLLSVNDLSGAEIDKVLARARTLEIRKTSDLSDRRSANLLGLLFTESSLRTRVGFIAAAARLGWQTASVLEQRANERSVAESVDDTLRVIAGFSTVVVARLQQPISTISVPLPVPLINGGDSGPSAEHPTQALIDLFSMEQELGPVGQLRVAICGDLRMRSSRSLVRLLARRPPSRLFLISVPELSEESSVASVETTVIEQRTLNDLSDVDVLYVAGIPHQAIPESLRDMLRVTQANLSTMPQSAIVLSPMPVIDEIEKEARMNSRIRMFEQSDRGVSVRMAILEHLTGALGKRPEVASAS